MTFLLAYLSYEWTKRIDLWKAFKNTDKMTRIAIRNLNARTQKKVSRTAIKESNKYSDYKIRLSVFENLEMNYIFRSDIRRFIPFLNIYVLCVGSILIGLLAFVWGLQDIPGLWIPFFIGIVASLIPWFLLNMLSQWNQKKMRESMGLMVKMLRAWLHVKEDMMYAMEKVVQDDSYLPKSLKGYLKEAVQAMKYGFLTNEVALDLFSYKVNNPFCYNFVLNIKQNMKSNGSLVKLIDAIVEQEKKVSREYASRYTSMKSDRIVLSGIILFIAIYTMVSLSNPTRAAYFMDTYTGQVLISVHAVSFLTGMIAYIRGESYEY